MVRLYATAHIDDVLRKVGASGAAPVRLGDHVHPQSLGHVQALELVDFFLQILNSRGVIASSPLQFPPANVDADALDSRVVGDLVVIAKAQRAVGWRAFAKVQQHVVAGMPFHCAARRRIR